MKKIDSEEENKRIGEKFSKMVKANQEKFDRTKTMIDEIIEPLKKVASFSRDLQESEKEIKRKYYVYLV